MRFFLIIIFFISFNSYSVVYENFGLAYSASQEHVCKNYISNNGSEVYFYYYNLSCSTGLPEGATEESRVVYLYGDQNCDSNTYESGICIVEEQVCEDGFPEVIIELNIDSCDRSDIQICDNGEYKLSNEVCDIDLDSGLDDSDLEEPVCSDQFTCFEYALEQDPYCTNYDFDYYTPDNFTMNCYERDEEILDGVVQDHPQDNINPIENPYENPDSDSQNAGDIAGSIQLALQSDFSILERAINDQTYELISGNTDLLDSLSGINSSIDNLNIGTGNDVNNDLIVSPSINDYEPTEGLEGFYDSEYPNGFSDVWSHNELAFNNTAFVSSLDDWKLTLVGTIPIFEFCFDFGFADFGCYNMTIPDYVFAFMKAVLLFSCAIFCRRIVFGG